MNSIVDDDDIDIYSDLNETSVSSGQTKNRDEDMLLDELQVYGKMYRLENELAKFKEKNMNLVRDNEELRSQIMIKDKQIQILKNNISSLYKTAKMELERRSKEKQELQLEYDTLVFRRMKNLEKIKNNKLNHEIVSKLILNCFLIIMISYN